MCRNSGLENFMHKGHSGDLGIDGRILLESIFEKYNMRERAGFD
jgi:hypothetical protein